MTTSIIEGLDRSHPVRKLKEECDKASADMMGHRLSMRRNSDSMRYRDFALIHEEAAREVVASRVMSLLQDAVNSSMDSLLLDVIGKIARQWQQVMKEYRDPTIVRAAVEMAALLQGLRVVEATRLGRELSSDEWLAPVIDLDEQRRLRRLA